MERSGNNHSLPPDTPSALQDEKPEKQRSLSSEDSVPSRAHEEQAERMQEKNLGDRVNEEEGERELEPVKSTQPSIYNVKSIPDGGLQAWLQVLGAFFLFFNSWGIINTFGSYQAYYEDNLLTSSTPSAISWIGSIQAFLLLLVGTVAGPIYDAGYFRELLVAGSFLLVFGQMMLSLCHAYWQVLLAQAICIGLGSGLIFIPSVAILSTYFSTKIGAAVGLAAAGSSLGGVIYPIMFHKLLPQIGFAWTTRAIGFMILGTMVIPNICMRVRVLPPTTRKMLDVSAFRIPAYTLDVLGFFVGFMGLYMPFFYAQIYAIQARITNPDLAFYLLAIMNSTSLFGRVIPNWAADKLGPFNVVIPCTVVTAILCFCFMVASSSASLIVLMAFYGFFSGSFVSLPPTIIVQLSLDARHKIGTRLGQSFALIAFGLLIGTPVGGAILDKSGFDAVWIFGGVLLSASAVLLVAARVCFKGWGVMVKA
ncbi:major facilitator superfamily domain-containing protein [Massariosphaeria phaeospora]|uniref:Major facilitator superfamily domain-containing protein n=1 Tax=Massariosphaeria phaeospora TaxID=100035 RepID=A0A7C8I224_9PLEO|nr:major facilitator superfamily domain-containing protein [Massariosphaeria phaeospora]